MELSKGEKGRELNRKLNGICLGLMFNFWCSFPVFTDAFNHQSVLFLKVTRRESFFLSLGAQLFLYLLKDMNSSIQQVCCGCQFMPSLYSSINPNKASGSFCWCLTINRIDVFQEQNKICRKIFAYFFRDLEKELGSKYSFLMLAYLHGLYVSGF